jgi:hypothetical protein
MKKKKYLKIALLDFLWCLFALLDSFVLIFMPWRWDERGQRESTFFRKITIKIGKKNMEEYVKINKERD